MKSNLQIIKSKNVSTEKLREFNNELTCPLSIIKIDGKYHIKTKEYENGRLKRDAEISLNGFDTIEEARAEVEFQLKVLYFGEVQNGDKVQITNYVEPYGPDDFFVTTGVVVCVVMDNLNPDINTYRVNVRHDGGYMTEAKQYFSNQVLCINDELEMNELQDKAQNELKNKAEETDYDFYKRCNNTFFNVVNFLKLRISRCKIFHLGNGLACQYSINTIVTTTPVLLKTDNIEEMIKSDLLKHIKFVKELAEFNKKWIEGTA
jgi:hypothetical protein